MASTACAVIEQALTETYDSVELDTQTSARYSDAPVDDTKMLDLQERYYDQVAGPDSDDLELTEAMSKLVAWTWIPGRNRTECPSILSYKDPRLVVMSRYPATPHGAATHIALAVHRPQVSDPRSIVYAGSATNEMFKDFSLPPREHGNGLILDAANEMIFSTALMLDLAMRSVAAGKQEPVANFDPPPVLWGFPRRYTPLPEWKLPLQNRVIAHLSPIAGAPTFKYFASPGGRIVSVEQRKMQRDGKDESVHVIQLLKGHTRLTREYPGWVKLLPRTVKDTETKPGEPLADVPRQHFASLKELQRTFSEPVLDWLKLRVLEELTSIQTIEEVQHDQAKGTTTPVETTWNTIQGQYVLDQAHLVKRILLDFREHVGRTVSAVDAAGRDLFIDEPNAVRIDVMAFPDRPTFDAAYCEGSMNSGCQSWMADILAINSDWMIKAPYLGVATEEPQPLRIAA